jgi:NAD-dependent dihydropyrimidine dehydrogenase PreA subunit
VLAGTVGKALDRGDRIALVRMRQGEAGVDGLGLPVDSIDEHGAGATLASLARWLCTGQVQLIAKYREKRRIGRRSDLARPTVYREMHARMILAERAHGRSVATRRSGTHANPCLAALAPDIITTRLQFDRTSEPAMPYVITEACIGTKDKACVDVCPVDCIYEGEQQLFIHPDECIDCGACEPECPVTAIFPEEDVPANLKQYVQINRDVFKSATPPGRPTR